MNGYSNINWVVTFLPNHSLQYHIYYYLLSVFFACEYSYVYAYESLFSVCYEKNLKKSYFANFTCSLPYAYVGICLESILYAS
ncbi:hypothetical protein B6U98_02050 [Thermoplasmatales archaeon ex4572_165]|nr:MAG: hypothetical protein B6U98_02050 [Thermoplasmatales archaeon ex4572_165]RLF59593.1 MAG: hypothetical protein DRN27_02070 [Thermoplasmata archaeon]